MRILFFLGPCAPQDVSQGSVLAMVRDLLDRRHDVTVVCPHGSIAAAFTDLGAVVCPNAFDDFDRFWASGALGDVYDVIHAVAGTARVWGQFARRHLGVPLFVSFPDGELDQVESFWPDCAGLFAGSGAIKAALLAKLPEAAARIHLMPLPVSPSGVGQLPAPVVHLPGQPLHILVADPAASHVLAALWALQQQRREERLIWHVLEEPPVGIALRTAAQTLAAAVSTPDIVTFRAGMAPAASAALEARCHIRFAPGQKARDAVARGVPTVALAPEGCFGLITQQNLQAALSCGFGTFGLTDPVTPEAVLDALIAYAEGRLLPEAEACGAVLQAELSAALWGARAQSYFEKALGCRQPSIGIFPFMPDTEAEYLTAAYAEAQVILEYGSGGSTQIAARMPGKYVMSVESDLAWARALRQSLRAPDVQARSVVHHADIGETGPWGRPLDDRNWQSYPAYSSAPWDQVWFRHPDLVLIDGRFRTACFATVLMRATRPVRILFDDYTLRPHYHKVEQVLKPLRLVGRLAEFHVEPGMLRPQDMGLLIQQFFWVTLHGVKEAVYNDGVYKTVQAQP